MGVEALPRTIEWVPCEGARGALGGFVRMVDQRKLPGQTAWWDARTVQSLIDAIQCLAVRGAPALGIAGAYGVCLAAIEARAACAQEAAGSRRQERCEDGVLPMAAGAVDGRRLEIGPDARRQAFFARLDPAARRVAEARPTAVNLAWGVNEALDAVRAAYPAHTAAPGEEAGSVDGGRFGTADDPVERAVRAAVARADELARRDEADNRAIGAHGAALLPDGARVLTHCNAGSLACGFYGTALGVVYAAFEQGKLAHVYADETRPVGQGARLTMWELSRAGVPCTLECDGMAASLMAAGRVDAVVVGADRIAANGDVANKIGTYQLAIAAAYHGVPFYVAAPTSTIDLSVASGAGIPIEHRDGAEVLAAYGAASGADGDDGAPSAFAPAVYNPAFDVTPASLVTAVVTERGVFAPGELRRAVGVGAQDRSY